MPLLRRKSACCYLGIDPGKSGGIAWINVNGVFTEHNSRTERQIWEDIKEFRTSSSVASFAVIEKVGGFIQGNALPGSAMFNFGENAGMLRAFVIAAGIPFELVTPQKWQKALGIPPRKKTESKGKFKGRLKQHAERLFPGVKITLATADALLIAEYARRFREGTL